jgi:hypothetical protein
MIVPEAASPVRSAPKVPNMLVVSVPLLVVPVKLA